MIKFYIENDQLKELKVYGDVSDISTDFVVLAAKIYDTLPEEAAELFKSVVRKAIGSKRSPVWKHICQFDEPVFEEDWANSDSCTSYDEKQRAVQRGFDTRLLYLRENSGKSISQLTSELDVEIATYVNWELGISEPSLEQLKKLSICFGVSADYLIGISK